MKLILSESKNLREVIPYQGYIHGRISPNILGGMGGAQFFTIPTPINIHYGHAISFHGSSVEENIPLLQVIQISCVNNV